MTNTEMSSMFDTLLNSYATRGLFGETASGSINLDEYEKSVYLTQAQDIIVKSYFDKTLNPQGQGFDDSARRQVDFSSLIKVENLTSIQEGYVPEHTVIHYDSYSIEWLEGSNNEIKAADLTITNKTADLLWIKISIDVVAESPGVNADFQTNTLAIKVDPQTLYGSGITLRDLQEVVEETVYDINSDTGEDCLVGDLIEFKLENIEEDYFTVGAGEEERVILNYPLEGYTEETIPATEIQHATFDDRGYIYKMPFETVGEQEISKVLFILNEKLIATDGYGDKTDFVIVPINYQEYDREMSKAYAQPLKKQAWRLFQNIETGFDIYSELIPRFDTNMTGAIYKVRYVRRPKPIVLSNLDGLSIEGETDESGCELNPILHMDIVQKAVELVYATRGARTSSNNS